MKQVATALLPLIYMSVLSSATGGSLLVDSRQCLVVTTSSWPVTTGTMLVLERETVLGEWHQRGPAVPVVVGKAGLAWGHGLTHVNSPPDPNKTEGDNKAPAGVFVLRGVFGYAKRAETKMPYLQASPEVICVDDPQSLHYNQLVDRSKVDDRDWRTAEEMRRKDDLYKWGVIVDHNSPSHWAPHEGYFRGPLDKPVKMPRPAGSCIFLHIWRGPDQPTVGCTAMSEKNILDIIHWLDPMKNPVLVQLPRPIYDAFRERWNLPPLP